MCIHIRPKHILARVMLDGAFSSLVTSCNDVMTRTSIVYVYMIYTHLYALYSGVYDLYICLSTYTSSWLVALTTASP